MTKDEIKKKAKTFSANYWYNANTSISRPSIEKLLIDFAEEVTMELQKEIETLKHNKETVAYLGDCISDIQDKKIAELEAQIEKMKNCINCELFIKDKCPYKVGECKMKYWKLKEK